MSPAHAPEARDSAAVHQAARLGTSGAGGGLPYFEQIQKSFGRHDVSGVVAHTGAAAEQGSRAMGAKAFTMGHHVAFAGAPSLHTAAHEAAHALQQRAGVVPAGGVGQSGDRHEHHADAVADKVVRGESSEAVLDASLGHAGSPPSLAIQREDEKKAPAAEPDAKIPAAKGQYTLDSFAFGGSSLTPEHEKQIDALVAELAANPLGSGGSILLVGHTDAVDSPERNLALGQARAESVRQKLLSKLPAQAQGQVKAVSLGKSALAVDTPSENRFNRRVEVHIQRASATVAPPPPMPSPSTPPPQQGPALPPKKEAAPAPALGSVPPAMTRRLNELAELIPAAGDAVKRDPLVRELRDLVVKIQPFLPNDEAKKKLDDAIASGVGEGIKEGIKALLEALAGRGPTAVSPDSSHTGPAIAPKDLKEQIYKGPAIPFGAAPPVRRYSFEFSGLGSTYKPGDGISFTVRTPDDFDPNGKAGAGRVIIMEAEDFQKNGGVKAERLGSKHIQSKGKVSLFLQAPDKPGRYVLGIMVGLSFQSHPVHEFKVGP
ncbi:OmpA family protein [Hyalangium gracile]|uniref:OmpA family protein n=1 Tax=Hyalangium gracile TaxID=394092 RepID=UPI001CCB2AC8|nr:OmpA family protein [Hyalangium gracile]